MLQQNITFCAPENKPCQADLYNQNSDQLCRDQYQCVLVTTCNHLHCVNKDIGKGNCTVDHVHKDKALFILNLSTMLIALF